MTFVLDGKTAEEWDAAANDALRREEESFQRSDTDGFLSQWCLSLSAQEYRRNAEIARNGGTATFVGLYEGDRRVVAKQISVPAFNAPWLTDTLWLLGKSETDLIERRGKRYLPVGSKSRVLKALGLAERVEQAPAIAKLYAPGRGLSGAASARIITVRTGDEWGSDATLPSEKASKGEI